MLRTMMIIMRQRRCFLIWDDESLTNGILGRSGCHSRFLIAGVFLISSSSSIWNKRTLLNRTRAWTSIRVWMWDSVGRWVFWSNLNFRLFTGLGQCIVSRVKILALLYNTTYIDIDILVSLMQYIHLTYLELMSQKIFTVRQLAIHLEELTFLVTKLLRKKKPKCQSWSLAKHIGIQCQAVLTLRSILFAFAGCIGVEWHVGKDKARRNR